MTDLQMSEIQGSAEWRQARCGKVGASRIADLMAKTKTGWGASRKNYAAELIVERLTGVPTEGFTNAAMQWGTTTEPQARAAYEFFRDEIVTECGFIPHPTIPMSGASPDGLVGINGLVEIKCPNSATHIEFLRDKTIPEKYFLQMQWQMACTGRDWVDFWSFDPRFPPSLQTFIDRVTRDDVCIGGMEKQVTLFLAEIDATIAALTGRSHEHLAGKLRASAEILMMP